MTYSAIARALRRKDSMRWFAYAFIVYILIAGLFDEGVLVCAFIGFCLGMLDRHFKWGIADSIIDLFKF